MAGKGGGAWKVAYADFVTAMMAFFLVMWIVGQDKPVKQAVAKYFEDPLGMDKGSRSTSLQGPEDSTTIGMFESGLGPARGIAMAQNKVVGRRSMVGVAAKRPPQIVIFRHFNRTYSVGTVIRLRAGNGRPGCSGEGAARHAAPVAPGQAQQDRSPRLCTAASTPEGGRVRRGLAAGSGSSARHDEVSDRAWHLDGAFATRRSTGPSSPTRCTPVKRNRCPPPGSKSLRSTSTSTRSATPRRCRWQEPEIRQIWPRLPRPRGSNPQAVARQSQGENSSCSDCARRPNRSGREAPCRWRRVHRANWSIPSFARQQG